ncbi:MAG TPA: glycerophosphodiester phosphodiesterase family protein, partial [Erythrobacter sp.]|nr:glycerophosphodiester phosphodiesterase family protein [Erythrobacter sp.]
MTKRHAPSWLTEWEYAHRGLHGANVPENSLQGARLAVEAGLGIECDIQRSLDDRPMVFHDWDLKRLTGA